MRGASQPPNLEFDPTKDAQNMSTFESEDGKEWFETAFAGELVPGMDGQEGTRSENTAAGNDDMDAVYLTA